MEAHRIHPLLHRHSGGAGVTGQRVQAMPRMRVHSLVGMDRRSNVSAGVCLSLPA